MLTYMKLVKTILSILLVLPFSSGFTQGTWTWVWGTQGNTFQSNSGIGNFSPTNNPTGRYAAVCWKDNNGKFWRYGGEHFGDLWQYAPATNQWALMHGATSINPPVVYGTQGVPAASNTPGEDSFGHPAWVDSQGNLWLYSALQTDDIWKYDITSNMWTWMKGTQNSGAAAVYGTQGIASPIVSPGMVNETDCKWGDNNGNLWLFNEFDGVLWKYDPSINQWTWVKGTPNNAAVYGTIGVAAPNNEPGMFTACPSVGALYCTWKDNNDNLWMIVNRDGGTLDAEIWKYSIASNQWTCMRVDVSNFGDPQTNYGTQCVESSTAFPIPRTENRARWVDDCNNLWLYGGVGFCKQGAEMNDLWRYNPTTNNWTWVRGTNTAAIYGTQGTGNSNNQPPPGVGQDHWQNQQGFWLQGGMNFNGAETHHIWLYQPDTIIANFNYNAASCLQYNFTGLSSSGCNNIKSYSWNFGDPASGTANTDTIPNPTHTFSGSGVYQVSLIVQNCTWDADTIVQTITINCGLNVTLTPDTICVGSCINLPAPTTGGVQPYTYQWDNGIPDTDSIADNLCPTTSTTYTVIVTDNIGDQDTATATITVLPIPIVNLGNDTIICGSNNFTLDAQNTGLSYLWSDNSTNQTLAINQTGSYWVTVNNGVCSVTDTINVTFGAINVNLGNDTTLCVGQGILLNAQNNGASYNWNTGANTQTLNVNQNGTYWVTVTQGVCTVSDTITISYNQPIASFQQSDTAGCPPLAIQFTDLSTPTGNINSWLWNFGDGGTSNQQNPNYNYTSSGTYDVSLNIIDINGCTDDSTQQMSITVYPIPSASFNYSPNEVEITNPTVQFADNSLGATTWYWDFGDGNTSTQQHPEYTYTSPGTYTITLTVTNQYGCAASISYTLIVESPFNIYVPNAFTPDGDGINDIFKAKGEGIEEFHLMVFDRWGELIFENNDINIGWDGTYKGVPVKSDVYVWKLKVKSDQHFYKDYTGHVTVLK